MNLLLVVLSVAAVTAAPSPPKESRVLEAKQQRWTAEGLKAYHAQMRKAQGSAYIDQISFYYNIANVTTARFGWIFHNNKCVKMDIEYEAVSFLTPLAGPPMSPQ
ncbi:hypothetical protein M3Y99_00241200 [Aphelenchoides fujianensis]|nr:hypothetical protein M3Y99_00241200 [Aphelenchoides fujianensis]